MPFISIIIPVYNAEEYLETALPRQVVCFRFR